MRVNIIESYLGDLVWCGVMVWANQKHQFLAFHSGFMIAVIIGVDHDNKDDDDNRGCVGGNCG